MRRLGRDEPEREPGERERRRHLEREGGKGDDGHRDQGTRGAGRGRPRVRLGVAPQTTARSGDDRDAEVTKRE